MGIGRIYCYFGRHVRSRGRARRVAAGWHSYCRNCGMEMIKPEDGEWSTVPKPEVGPVAMADAGGEAVVPRRSRLARLLRRGR